MRILLAIVHYWDPQGGGHHQSLRPNPQPRIDALQQQLLCLRRLGGRQSYLHMVDRAVYPANDHWRHQIDVCLVTDGEHHVLDRLDPVFGSCYRDVPTSPANGRLLGFEAQKVLAEALDEEYDLYGYLEDDLLIHDPCFFHKLLWFTQLMGSDAVLLPQRIELCQQPHLVDRFYIDGPIAESELRQLVPQAGPVRLVEWGGGTVAFEPPLNPHAGCFFLTHEQLSHWSRQPWWQDGDTSFISPLESAATLGIAKTFALFKPCLSHAAWLEVQHFGTSFHGLIQPPAA
jgi:hypothetical protein